MIDRVGLYGASMEYSDIYIFISKLSKCARKCKAIKYEVKKSEWSAEEEKMDQTSQTKKRKEDGC